MKFNAIILAGGKSRRMGSDKALLELEGKSLLQRTIDLCEPDCEQILISSNNPAHGLGKYRVVADEFPDSGPMSGIYSALKQSDSDWNFVISVDAPFVTSDLISKLSEKAAGHNALVPSHSGKLEPLLAFYHKKCIPVFEKRLRAGRLKMHDLIEELDALLIDFSESETRNPNLFRNMNRPEDF